LGREAFVGVDIGSATIKVAAVDRVGELVGTPVYLRNDAFESPLEALKHAFHNYLESADIRVAGVGTTGSGRDLSKKVIGADLSRTEIFAHAVGVTHMVQSGKAVIEENGAVRRIDRVGTVLEIGGQDSKVIVFDDAGIPAFFNMNSICSAGTGEFLKQLADEARLDISDLGPIALTSRQAARIDATCTVFSKRDFRHLTQKGVPLADRLMGACEAMVNNYLRNVVQDANLREPIFFQGGVAFNPAVRHAFERRLATRIVVTPRNDVVGAIGMAVIVRDHVLGNPGLATGFREDFFERCYDSRVRYCHGCANACDLAQPFEVLAGEVRVLDTLGGRCEGSQNPKNVRELPQALRSFQVPVIRTPRSNGSRFDVANPLGSAARSGVGRYFAGLDGGSRSTKYALLRATGDERDVEVVVAGSVDTAGDVLSACLRSLRALRDALPAGAVLDGIGTTGSAGEVFRDVVTERDRDTADYRSTEIVSHYAWASHTVPNVGTVIDIGGNDAKIIVVNDGGLDFAMNDKCAAGTGSFIEAVARRFRVPIEDYAATALSSRDPARIAGRCAVFGESDIVHKSRIGFAPRDLFLGLAYSICRTYLSDVAKGKPLRVPIVAQGGTFLNEAVQQAFRDTLGLREDEFIVASDPRLVLCAGALGAALLAKGKYEQGYDTHFKGFERILSARFETVTTTCTFGPCWRRCDGLVALLEDGTPVAGYKSVDCHFGMFDGMINGPAEREHVERLLGRVVVA
jgi:predicted CoA-substrate-specific enzyme activase